MYSPNRSKTIDRSFTPPPYGLFRVIPDATRLLPSVRRLVGHARQPGHRGPAGRGAGLLVAVGRPAAVLSARAPQRLPLGARAAVAGAVPAGGGPDRDAGPRGRCHPPDPAGDGHAHSRLRGAGRAGQATGHPRHRLRRPARCRPGPGLVPGRVRGLRRSLRRTGRPARRVPPLPPRTVVRRSRRVLRAVLFGSPFVVPAETPPASPSADPGPG